MNEKQKELTHLLLQARLHHFRITTEDLPNGLIIVDRDAVIESLDRWAGEALDLAPEELRGTPLAAILKEKQDELRDAIRTRRFGYIGIVELLRGSREPLPVNIVLAPCIQPHKVQVNIIFSDYV